MEVYKRFTEPTDGEGQGALIGELARQNINIMDIDDDYIFFEFQFKMGDGRAKWCRSVYKRHGGRNVLQELELLMDTVRAARVRAEAYEQR